MENKTYSAGQAYIEIGGETAGYIRNINFTENITRVPVRGLGRINLQEAPSVAIDCQFTVDQFFLDFNTPVLKKMMNRYATVQQILDTLVLGELSFDIVMYKKTIASRNNQKIVTSINATGETIVMLSPCYVNNQQFSFAEGGIAGFNISGLYINPVSIIENK